jgi:hypothetical protein
MALFIQQNDNRSKLQERLETELRAKAKARADIDTTLPDGVDDSNYLKGTKKTTTLAWVWIAIILLAVFGLIFFLITSNS